MVMVDRFLKMAHFLPCTKTITSEGAANLLLKEVIRVHGLPNDIVSDRGPQFVAKFWKQLTALLNVRVSLSFGYHPQTDGQTERTIQQIHTELKHQLECAQAQQKVAADQHYALINTVLLALRFKSSIVFGFFDATYILLAHATN